VQLVTGPASFPPHTMRGSGYGKRIGPGPAMNQYRSGGRHQTDCWVVGAGLLVLGYLVLCAGAEQLEMGQYCFAKIRSTLPIIALEKCKHCESTSLLQLGSRTWRCLECGKYMYGGVDRVSLFWRKVAKGGPDDCWLWNGSRLPAGYGLFRSDNGKLVVAHVYAYELLYGPTPPGLDICHVCDNPPCVNEAHLFSGTRLDNMRDAQGKGRLVRPVSSLFCSAGHKLFGPNIYITKTGYRACRDCRRQWQRDSRAVKRAVAK
jgi:hypothetical protein